MEDGEEGEAMGEVAGAGGVSEEAVEGEEATEAGEECGAVVEEEEEVVVA